MITLTLQYLTLFSFQVVHEYYNDEIIPNLQIVPSANTAHIIRRLGLILKQQGNTLSLLMDKQKRESFAILPSDAFQFSFFIFAQDHQFLQFAELPIEFPEHKILCFSNYTIQANEYASLSKKEIVTLEDCIEHSSLSHSLPSSFMHKKPIAVAEIFLPETFQKEISTTQHDPLRPLTYFIKFPARKTYWKYAFVCTHRTLEAQAEINCLDQSASFIRHKNEILPNQQEAAIFISEAPMILQKRSGYELRLTQKDKFNKLAEIIPKLPLPTLSMIKPGSRATDAKLFSEIVVYL